MPEKGLGDLDLGAVKLRGKKVSARVEQAVTGVDIERTIDGASTVRMSLIDAERELVQSSLFSGRVAITLDGLVFELVNLSKSGDDLALTFESAGVGDLRRKRGMLVAKKGTTTRTEFAKRLVDQVRWLKFRGEKGVPNRTQLARDKRENSWDALGRLASDRNWRRFESEGTLYFGSDDWLAGLAPALVIRERDAGVQGIDFDIDGGRRADTCTLVCEAKRWAARPGHAVRVLGLGELAAGTWLVESIARSLFATTCSVTLTRKARELPEPKPDEERHDDTGTGGARGTVDTGRASAKGWVWPCRGTITGVFGEDRGTHAHSGIDIAAARGTPIGAAKAGTVTFAGVSSGYGNLTIIEHGSGFTSYYAHQLQHGVRAGQRVEQAEQIGTVDSTGNSTGDHLHFEIRVNGRPVNPASYLP